LSRGTPRVWSVPSTRACGVTAFASTLPQVTSGRVHAAGCYIRETIAEAVVEASGVPEDGLA
jgi:hypothetical protein